jgi:hypothetical protein
VLGRVWTKFGLSFEKLSDGVSIAEKMAESPAEIRHVLEIFIGSVGEGAGS